MSKRILGAFMLVLACAAAAFSQETTSTTQQTTTTTSQQPSTQTIQPSTQSTSPPDYVFPSHDERFKRYLKSTIGPFSLVRTGISAGLNQWHDSPEEWGQGMKGYGKLYASGFGRNAIQQTVTYGLDEAFHLDTGFERSKREGFGARLKDALLQNVTSRTRSGKRVISAPRFVGVYTGAIVAHETWYPERYSYKDGLRSGSMTLLTGFGINLFREFVVNW